MIEFNLKIGQVNDQIYQELKDKVSGESSQQMAEFYYPNTEVEKRRWQAPEIMHEVINADEHYAVIQKNWSVMEEKRYYLTGISDEGFYFVHEIPDTLVQRQLTMQQLVDAVNMKDQGYERIQGDVITKIVPVSEFQIHEAAEMQFRKKKKAKLVGFFKREQLVETDEMEVIPESLYPKTLHDFQHKYNSSLLFAVTEYKSGLGQVEMSTIPIFTNHRLTVKNGKIYSRNSGSDGSTYVVMGESLELIHNEHSPQTIHIPLGHCVVITTQQSPQSSRNHD